MAVCVTADGARALTAGDTSVRIWCVASGSQLRLLSSPSAVHAAALTPDGHHVLTASADGAVRVWSVVDGTVVHEFIGRTRSVLFSVCVSPDGALCITGARTTRTVRVWSLGAGGSAARVEGALDLKPPPALVRELTGHAASVISVGWA